MPRCIHARYLGMYLIHLTGSVLFWICILKRYPYTDSRCCQHQTSKIVAASGQPGSGTCICWRLDGNYSRATTKFCMCTFFLVCFVWLVANIEPIYWEQTTSWSNYIHIEVVNYQPRMRGWVWRIHVHLMIMKYSAAAWPCIVLRSKKSHYLMPTLPSLTCVL